MRKGPKDKLGMSIRGGVKNQLGNPLDNEDEGIFISKVKLLASLNSRSFCSDVDKDHDGSGDNDCRNQ